LQVRRANRDARGNTHVRFEQFYRGLRVFEGEAIAHVDANGDVTVTSSLHGNLNLDPRPRVGRDAAVATALRSIAPLGASEVRDASLVVLPRGARSIVDRVTWQIVVSVENEFEDPAEWHYFVDAATGEVAYSFNGLETAKGGGKPGGGGGGGGAVGPVAGTARTMFSGSQAITVDQTASSTFYLRDPNRGGTGRSGSGNFTCDMRNGQALCYYVTSSSSTFGDSVISTTGLTAAADAHFGLQATWDFYRNTFQRTGIDGVGTQTYSRVHYGRGYENAFWSDSCFCMTYGDGKTSFYPLVSLDVAGHEMSHGVMSTEANLTYSGESGGLNESSSDIFGTLVEYSANNSQDVGDYWIGERILKSNYVNGTFNPTSALRYMDDPAKDGISPACWSDSVGNLNVHYSSGPNNHMFYLLAEGGKSACNGAQVSGIGRTKAGAIWYDAITNHMTASTDYHGARAAALASAATLFGNGSPEYNAVAAAYSAIDVN
jgi:Zn-dependent metalloprotease